MGADGEMCSCVRVRVRVARMWRPVFVPPVAPQSFVLQRGSNAPSSSVCDDERSRINNESFAALLSSSE